jgi:hypothetical protein
MAKQKRLRNSARSQLTAVKFFDDAALFQFLQKSYVAKTVRW